MSSKHLAIYIQNHHAVSSSFLSSNGKTVYFYFKGFGDQNIASSMESFKNLCVMNGIDPYY